MAVDTGSFAESVGSWRSRLGKWAEIRPVTESPEVEGGTVTFQSGWEWSTHQWKAPPQSSPCCPSSLCHPPAWARVRQGSLRCQVQWLPGGGKAGPRLPSLLWRGGVQGIAQHRVVLKLPIAASFKTKTENKLLINFYAFASKSFFHLYLLLKNLKNCVLSCFSWVQLCDPMDDSPPGFSVHGILQARILEWISMPPSRGSSQPRVWTHVPDWQGGSLPLAPPWKPSLKTGMLPSKKGYCRWKELCWGTPG